jgi:hypothetical protein
MADTNASQASTSAVLFETDAAAYLGLRPQTLRLWRSKKKRRGPAYVKLGDGPGARVRYRIADLDAWLAQQVVTPRRPGRPRKRAA